MKIEYYHASRFGNGATVARGLKEQMAAKGVTVAVHHIREVNPTELAPADLYVFVLVMGLKGPLEDDWQEKVGAFVAQLPIVTTHV